MDLKNAVAVCLISLFSATLVLLIARALDLQAASRIEPQLAQIVEELQALRKQGGLAAAPGTAGENGAMNNGLMVYYFHGNVRCPTCRSIESQSHDTVHTDFASQLESGDMEWKILNYEEPAGADLGKKFEIQMPVVVLAQMTDGEIGDWKRLDKVWALVGKKAAFAEYIRSEINQMLDQSGGQPTATPNDDAPDASVIPIPATDPDLPPLPSGPNDVPVPDDLPVPDEYPQSDDTPALDTVPVPDDLPVPE
jgi:hypothetical protein